MLAPLRPAASIVAAAQQFAKRVHKLKKEVKGWPVLGSLSEEIEGIKKLHDQRQKRLMDYDYYKRKVTEMNAKPPKDGSKLTRNAEKLAASEAAYLNAKNELVARMQALLDERWDFANAPLLQLLDFLSPSPLGPEVLEGSSAFMAALEARFVGCGQMALEDLGPLRGQGREDSFFAKREALLEGLAVFRARSWKHP